MKHFAVALLLFVVVLSGVAMARPRGKYTTKYDSVDLDAIIKNDRLMKAYVDCVMERKKCTKDGAEFKKNIPDALQNNCANCNEVQKAGTRKILRHLVKNKRDWYLEVEAKYDPTHIFRRLYHDDLQKEGVVF